MDLSQERFERCLADHEVPEVATSFQRTAVAALLRFDRTRPEVLLMKRAEREDDRWSGHVSMPGGRESTGDSDLLATAVRETREEVGVDLHHSARVIGRLEPIRAIARGRVMPMIIAPFVFVQTRAVTVQLGEEAHSAFWFPLDRAAAGELSDEYVYQAEADILNLPCWRYQGYVVWGLTYRMLRDLLCIVTEISSG